MLKSILFSSLMLFTLVSSADEHHVLSSAVVQSAPTKREFMVSGILRKPSADISVRLVHSLVVALSTDEAIGKFTRNALATYPGYSMASTLATVVATPLPRGCDVEI